MISLDSVHAVDFLVPADCVGTATERDCVVQQLRLLNVGPIRISTKASDSNIVKIVASLAILAVSMLLFLYFRRHYRTYQQRRARRMRRIKDALGMGPAGHGIMFNGLDGDEADWQIMPMPVGYAAEEEGEPELHQDENLRNLIKDISNRPNRCIPEYTPAEEVRLELGTDPIAQEVGLAPGGAPGVRVSGEAGSASPRRAGGRASGECASGDPAVPVATAGALVSGTRVTHTESHPSGVTSVNSGNSGARTLATMLAAARGQGQGNSGGNGAGAGHGSSPLTEAGVNALLATRVAAAAVASAAPGTAAAAAAAMSGASSSGCGAPASRERGPALVGPGSASGPEAAAAARGGTATIGAAAVPTPLASGGSGGGGNRHATTYAAADVAQRVMRSKDSDDEAPDTEMEVQKTQATDLMDELELLRRDIMAGINDTQLQIMSVVGSGAFGTVYRGQWQGLEVAVKTVVFSASSENRKRALQEAALCQSINHRNIVATYAVDVQPLGAVNTPALAGPGGRSSTLSTLLDWRLYIVQEYCDGGPLRKLVQSRYLQSDAGPNMSVICEVALELAQALSHLHSKNIIHGDLNPNNVLLKRDASSPNGFRVKMADFGLSVMVPIQKTHMSNLRLGTLYYIAPETCFRGQLGYAADVFSLGVMLWELYHGRLAGTRTAAGEPRYQPDFPDFPAACPVDYRKLAHRCLQKQPHNRLHSSQVVQRLQEMLSVFRAAGPRLPLEPLPLGGPDDSTHAVTPAPAAAAAAAAAAMPAAGPMFAQRPSGVGMVSAKDVVINVGRATGAGTGDRTGAATGNTATPVESRHGPATPRAAGAPVPEILPAPAESPTRATHQQGGPSLPQQQRQQRWEARR
ncbi:hypothetical protein GPECTOR_5g378 [Gonium pectorale]|uniref:Protein kinase domain-containing protein n=1 Tax=Gonium pectorale TaxID=33097 RepID=A0A150GWR3_GONPE|nr:hypothetical protein GPECTOR_5g378 [Gonium pectorale]|eukprot:KXZ54291.1 hypothetical protein GPECTOR_5g378 [Gonium pectorale]